MDPRDPLAPTSQGAAEPRPHPFRPFPTTNVVLFALTVVTTFWTGAIQATDFYGLERLTTVLGYLSPPILVRGWIYAVPFLAILLCHEFGHYLFARHHRVDASLPYFIPLPPAFLFGTMGAIIRMRSPIDRRDALLDIGAAGPLAGLAVAIPVTAYGLYLSFVGPVAGAVGLLEGQSLLYLALKEWFVGPIPAGYDVFLHPMAWAGWGGLLVTMINLVPVGQLDGGHIAYALLGPRQDRISNWIHVGLAGFGLAIVAYWLTPPLLPGGLAPGDIGQAVSRGIHWLFWAGLLLVLRRMTGPRHPPTGSGELSPLRIGIALACLAAFVLLFMPTWISQN